jgi:hypothetical protein
MADGPEPPSVEQLAANLAAVTDESSYSVPSSILEEIEAAAERLDSAEGSSGQS